MSNLFDYRLPTHIVVRSSLWTNILPTYHSHKFPWFLCSWGSSLQSTSLFSSLPFTSAFSFLATRYYTCSYSSAGRRTNAGAQALVHQTSAHLDILKRNMRQRQRYLFYFWLLLLHTCLPDSDTAAPTTRDDTICILHEANAPKQLTNLPLIIYLFSLYNFEKLCMLLRLCTRIHLLVA